MPLLAIRDILSILKLHRTPEIKDLVNQIKGEKKTLVDSWEYQVHDKDNRKCTPEAEAAFYNVVRLVDKARHILRE